MGIQKKVCMANKRFYKLEEVKRRFILETALKEFATKGYAKASINQISRSAGLSAGNLYYYVENKEDLYLTVVDYVFEEFRLFKGESELSFWEEVEEGVKNRVHISRCNQVIGTFINRFFEYESIDGSDDVEHITRKKIQSELRKIFDEGIRRGEIRNDLPGDYLFNIHLGLVLTTNRWLSSNLKNYEDDESVNKLVKKAISLIKDAMSPKDLW